MMTMYDELIEELRRHHCDAKEDDTQEVCEECAYDVIIEDKSVPSGIASVCVWANEQSRRCHRGVGSQREISRISVEHDSAKRDGAVYLYV